MGKSKKIGPISFLLRFVLGFTWLTFWSTLCMTLMVLALPFRTLRIRIGNLCGKMIGPFITRIVGTRLINPDSQKLKNGKPAIYVTNHTSALDIFISMSICPYGGCGVNNDGVGIPPLSVILTIFAGVSVANIAVAVIALRLRPE